MRVVIIGAGLQGRRRALALRAFPNTELASVCDTNRDAAARLAAEVGCVATTDWEESIRHPEIDAVLVCTPPDMHASITIAALSCSKHVLCEKPLATTVSDAEQMVITAQRQGLVLKCGFNLRHHPGIGLAKKWVDEGEIGEPNFIRCVYGMTGRLGYETEWRGDPEIAGGGQLMDQGIHALDLALWFLGEFSHVSGVVTTKYWNTGVEDNAFALLSTAREQVACLHVSWTEWKNKFLFEVFGQDGYASVEGLGGSYGVERARLGKRAFGKPFREEVIEFRSDDKSWEEEWKEFVDSIQEQRQPMGSGVDGLRALRLASAVYEAANRRIIKSLEERWRA